MANDLASYRTLVDEILGTAVDSSTWTDTLIDEALRHALAKYDRLNVYETSFEVQTTGYEQDLSSVTGLDNLLAVAYPWTDGADFTARRQYFRQTADQTIYFEDVEPQDGETIRVRYSKRHAIKDLDSAAATTVPTRHQRIVGLLAAEHACNVRRRQIGENPAIPREALDALRETAARLADEADTLITSHRAGSTPRWTDVGL